MYSPQKGSGVLRHEKTTYISQLPNDNIQITSQIMIQPLSEILKFRNSNITRRFSNMYPHIEASEVTTIFEDMLRYLWLTANLEVERESNPETPDVTIWGGMIIIDEMWHAFILYTQIYADFCDTYFGRFIHHPPPISKFTRKVEELGKETCNEILVDELITAVYERLGEEVALRWFDTYFEKYNNKNWIH